jgi:hypothetical protein
MTGMSHVNNIFRVINLVFHIFMSIRCHKYYYLNQLYVNYCVDTSAGGLLVPEGIFRPVVSDWIITWITR